MVIDEYDRHHKRLASLKRPAFQSSKKGGELGPNWAYRYDEIAMAHGCAPT